MLARQPDDDLSSLGRFAKDRGVPTNGVFIFVRKEIRVPHDTEQNEQS